MLRLKGAEQQLQLQLQLRVEESAMPNSSRKPAARNRASRRVEDLAGESPSPLAGPLVRNPLRVKADEIEESSKTLHQCRVEWQEAMAKLKVTSPMDEEFPSAVMAAERTSMAYLGATKLFQRACEKV